jgi:hypothetical protein
MAYSDIWAERYWVSEMQDPYGENSLRVLKMQLGAWQRHISALELRDRQRFIVWMSQELSLQEFALIVDGEILRETMWEIYLEERYGK